MDLNRGYVLDNKVISFYVNKTAKQHSIALNRRSLAIAKHNANLFIKKPTAPHVNRELKKIAAQMGVNRKISFHVARHTFATNFLRAGGDVVKLREIMDHEDITTTMIYVHIVNKEAHADMALLDNLF
jgi:site-specific recombinase XerD